MSRRHAFSVRSTLFVMTLAFLPIAVARAESHPDAWITMKAKAALEVAALPAPQSSRTPIKGVSSVRHNPGDSGDEVIRRGVEKALLDLDARANSDIRVMVKDGVVWLTGTVPAWEGNSARVYAARSVTGVRSIINGLRVVGAGSAAR
ncbi:MAG: BON domain-containing protein [Acidobacteriia bacterium]|nr:BON domain-containing protein [Terriglobia bacterium]